MAEQKLTAIMIIEVAGKPPEYLSNSIKNHVEKLKAVKGVEIINSTIADPRLIEGEKDLYTCFAEVEVSVVGMFKLLEIIFDFMPSSIEIIEPADIELNCQEATMFVNDLAGRLHKYDNLAKMARSHIQNLSDQLKKVQQNPQKTNATPIQPVKITLENTEKPEVKNNSKKKKKAKK